VPPLGFTIRPPAAKIRPPRYRCKVSLPATADRNADASKSGAYARNGAFGWAKTRWSMNPVPELIGRARVAGLQSAQKIFRVAGRGVAGKFLEIVDECFEIRRRLGERRNPVEESIVREIVAQLGFERGGRVLAANLALELAAIGRKPRHLLENFLLGFFHRQRSEKFLRFRDEPVQLARHAAPFIHGFERALPPPVGALLAKIGERAQPAQRRPDRLLNFPGQIEIAV